MPPLLLILPLALVLMLAVVIHGARHPITVDKAAYADAVRDAQARNRIPA